MSLKTTDEPVVFTEYDSAALQLTADQARILRRLAREKVSILPGDGAAEWHVKTTHYVGTIVTPDVRILITPKVNTANLFYLLEASGNPVDIGPAVFDYDKTRDLIPSFATFYARHLEKALARGIPRAYQEIRERVRECAAASTCQRRCGWQACRCLRNAASMSSAPTSSSTGSSAAQPTACCACPG